MKISVKDLISIATQEREFLNNSHIPAIDDVHRFILTVRIKKGKHTVKTAMLWKAYKLWSGKPVRRIAFFNSFSEFFEAQCYNGKYRYYMLNYSPIQLLNRLHNMNIKLEKE